MLISLIALLLVFSCSLSFSAENLNQVGAQNQESYNQFLAERDFLEDFVSYEDVSFLGAFDWFSGHLYNDPDDADFVKYTYAFLDKKQQCLILNCYRYLYENEKRLPKDINALLCSQASDSGFEYTVLQIDPWEDLRFCAEKGDVVLTVGDLYYCYRDGELKLIAWQQQDYAWMRLFYSSDKIGEKRRIMKNLTEDDFMYQLCHLSTMEEAKNLLLQATKTKRFNADISTDAASSDVGLTDVENVDEPHADGGTTAFPWLWVCIGGGAAVVIGGAVAAALILRKKRRKAAADFC